MKVNIHRQRKLTFTDKKKRSPVPKWTKDMNKQCPKIKPRQTQSRKVSTSLSR